MVAQPAVSETDGPLFHGLALGLAQDFRLDSGGYPYPLYIIFLAAIYVLGGDFQAVFLVQGLLFGLTVSLSYWLAQRLAGHGAGICAALLVMFDVSLLGNVGLILTENLQAPLLMLAFIVSLFALERRQLRYDVGAGVAWGLLTLVKPATIFWPLALLPVYILARHERGWVLKWLVLLPAFILVLSPWLVRNQLTENAPTIGQPFSPLLIHVVDEGELKHDLRNLVPKIDRAIAEAEAAGKELGTLQFELNTLRLLWERIERSPTAYTDYVWEKFSSFWTVPANDWPYSANNSSFPHGFRSAPGQAQYERLYALLALAGLFSLLLIMRRSPRTALFFAMFVLYYGLFYTMTLYIPRYSGPAMPLVLVGGAVLPGLLAAALREKDHAWRLPGNLLLAALVMALPVALAYQIFLQGPAFLKQGSFETDQAAAAWRYEAVVGEGVAPLEVDPYRARDGFRSALLEIKRTERGRETRIIQDAPVWFGTTYRLKFSYRFASETPLPAHLYVEILEWDLHQDGWRRTAKVFQPMVSGTWMEQEYEFAVSGSGRAVSIIFGLLNEPGKAYIDHVRLELAASPWERITRPYLLADPGGLPQQDFLPLREWVETQPEADRAALLDDVDAAQAGGWRGGEGRLARVAIGAGAVVVALWAALGLAFVRLRVLERIAQSRLLDALKVGAMALAVLAQAATCYLVLFSNPT